MAVVQQQIKTDVLKIYTIMGFYEKSSYEFNAQTYKQQQEVQSREENITTKLHCGFQ